jgi:hypothetical protein
LEWTGGCGIAGEPHRASGCRRRHVAAHGIAALAR